MNPKRIMSLAIAVLLFLVAGCGGGAKDRSSSTSSTNSTQTDTKTANKEPILLGAVFPINLAIEDVQKVKDAFEMAAEEVTKAGGAAGHPIKIAYFDETADVAETMKKIDDAKPFALIGFASSANALKYYPEIMKTRRIMMITGATATELTDAVTKDPQTNKYLFRNGSQARDTARAGVAWLRDVIQAKSYLLIAPDNAAGKSLDTALADLAKADGITSVGSYLLKDGDTNYEPIWKMINEKKPAAVVTGLQGGLKGFWPAYVNKKIPLPLFESQFAYAENETTMKKDFGDKFDIVNYLGAAVSMRDLPISSKTRPFYAAFRARTGKEPQGVMDIRSADAVAILAEAITQAGGPDTDKVIATLEKRTFTGIAGNYEFDSSHQAKWGRKFVANLVGQWQGGKFEIVWPADTKTASYTLAPWWKQ